MKSSKMCVVCLSLLLAVAGCDKKESPVVDQPGGGSGAAAPAGKEVGEALAKDMIGAFDQIVDEVAQALEGKPAQAEVMPKLQAIYEAWLPKMEAFAARRKELTDPPVKGAFHSYMGEHRGKAMFNKDNKLGKLVQHYRMMSPAPEVVAFIEKNLIELMEIAHTK